MTKDYLRQLEDELAAVRERLDALHVQQADAGLRLLCMLRGVTPGDCEAAQAEFDALGRSWREAHSQQQRLQREIDAARNAIEGQPPLSAAELALHIETLINRRGWTLDISSVWDGRTRLGLLIVTDATGRCVLPSAMSWPIGSQRKPPTTLRGMHTGSARYRAALELYQRLLAVEA